MSLLLFGGYLAVSVSSLGFLEYNCFFYKS